MKEGQSRLAEGGEVYYKLVDLLGDLFAETRQLPWLCPLPYNLGIFDMWQSHCAMWLSDFAAIAE